MPSPQRPDLASTLQAAVADRDALLARRLADQFVHRRGVVALEALLGGPLLALQGPDAVAWLAELVRLPVAPSGSLEAPAAAPTPDPEPRPAPPLVVVPPLERPVSPAPAPAALASLRSWLPDANDLPQAG